MSSCSPTMDLLITLTSMIAAVAAAPSVSEIEE
jgi:hypothetical protein